MESMPDLSEYCRQLEAYLCQKNGGHLIRIVGPAFERVCGWAEQGVPLTVARSGIDRYCERQQAKTTRQRPVRIEFCEADVLALFDDWRRAIGVVLARRSPEGGGGQASAGEPAPEPVRKAPRASHLERVVARLMGRRAPRSAPFEQHVEQLIRALDLLAAAARHARGEARAEIVERLATLDRELMAAAVADLDAVSAAALRREAEEELVVFGSRMPPEARAQAADAAYQRLVRESLGLPTVRYG
jgi:hypothetical protein